MVSPDILKSGPTSSSIQTTSLDWSGAPLGQGRGTAGVGIALYHNARIAITPLSEP